MDSIALHADQIQLFLLVFVRITTMIAMLPVFGNQAVPIQLRVGFSIILTAVIFATLLAAGKTVIPQPLSVGMFILMIMKEVMVGLAVGFVSLFLFAAVQFAGRLVDTEIGFSFVELVDPFTDELITVMGQLQVVLFTILFLLFNGHYFMLLAIEKSFDIVPLANAHFQSGPLSVQVTRMVGDIFVIGLKFSAPVYVTLILTEVAMGVVARTVPQINIFFVGLPLKIALGLATMIIVLPALASLFKTTVEGLIQDIWKILYLMA